MLDRVKIMRVFDFVGMVEAVSEVREKLESQRDHLDKQPRPPQVMADVQQQQQQPQQDSAPKLQRIRSTIPDSEDEEDEDDVMLFDEVDGPLEEETRHEKPPELSGIPQENRDSKTTAEDVRIGMIVIDNITHVVGPMMKTNYVQGMPWPSPRPRSPTDIPSVGPADLFPPFAIPPHEITQPQHNTHQCRDNCTRRPAWPVNRNSSSAATQPKARK